MRAKKGEERKCEEQRRPLTTAFSVAGEGTRLRTRGLRDGGEAGRRVRVVFGGRRQPPPPHRAARSEALRSGMGPFSLSFSLYFFLQRSVSSGRGEKGEKVSSQSVAGEGQDEGIRSSL